MRVHLSQECGRDYGSRSPATSGGAADVVGSAPLDWDALVARVASALRTWSNRYDTCNAGVSIVCGTPWCLDCCIPATTCMLSAGAESRIVTRCR